MQRSWRPDGCVATGELSADVLLAAGDMGSGVRHLLSATFFL
jgi:hypothetical protein